MGSVEPFGSAAYEVLVGVAENYYDKLQPYMTAVFDLTVKAGAYTRSL